MNCLSTHPLLRKWMQSLKCGVLIGCATMMLSLVAEAGTNFYVDPDWAGTTSGTASQPFSVLNTTAWSTVNTALATGDVTIYFSALKANGVTQQSRAWFVECKRWNYGPNRLTLDGYSKYNSNITTPNWLSNPEPSIALAYTTGKVFQLTGSSSSALGWIRASGNDFVTHNGLVYCCIESHLAAPDNEPGVGANWPNYWDQHGSSGTAWASGQSYKCYVKQNNITLRGFEITGVGARSSFNGDNFIWEYNYIHDITEIGPGMALLYTSAPDSSAAVIISRPSTNLIFRHFRVVRTYGEGFYLGAINPSAPAVFQAAHGNQHSNILIDKFLIDYAGVNGAQGDGIDCKHGITNLTIRDGEISYFNGMGGINLPGSAININQNILVERVFIHDSIRNSAAGGQSAIYATMGGATSTSMYGYVGVTIRNCIAANTFNGIVVNGVTGYPADQIKLHNNTVYNVVNTGLSAGGNITNSEVTNNLVFATGTPRGVVSSSGVTSDYNTHDGTWTSANEGSHTLALTSSQALAAVVNAVGEDFHPSSGSILKRRALTIAGFSDDFYRTSRASENWDIGAVQTGGRPAAPRDLHVVP